jgi:hypothetical protein
VGLESLNGWGCWGPLRGAETMGVLLFGPRSLAHTLLPGRAVIPLVNLSVGEVTIVPLVGIALGMLVCFAIR